MAIRQAHKAAPLFALFLFLIPLSAFSQDDSEEAFGLEEIIVTAQKSFETVQDVPISISAYSYEAVTKWDLNDVFRIEALTPGFSASSFSIGQPQLYIRGIGSNEDGAGGDPSVGVYLDGVYIARPSANTMSFNDILRIEVLRGPQGTLYGKNATGGAINIVTQRPHEVPEGAVELSVGELGKIGVKLKANIPHSDTFFSSLALLSDQQDGYVTNDNTGTELQSLDDQALRWQTLVAIAEESEFLFSIDADQMDRTGNGRRVVGSNDFTDDLSSLQPKDKFHIRADTDGYQKRDSFGGKLEYSTLFNDLGFISITGFRNSSFEWQEDLDGTDPQTGQWDPISDGLDLATMSLKSGSGNVIDTVDEASEQYSQEFRLSKSDTEFIDWVVGIYYLYETARRQESFEFLTVSGFPVPLILPPMLWGPEDSVIDGFDQRNATTSAAIFAQTTSYLTEELNLVIGLRYTKEKKDFSNRGYSNNEGVVNLVVAEDFYVNESESWGATTGRLALEYEWYYGLTTYISADRGFKSGGFQGQSSSADVAGIPFDPEFANNYELGMKSKWLDDRIKFNVAYYYIDYSDLQVLQFVAVGQSRIAFTENAGQAISQGLEIELDSQITAGWRMGMTYAYNDGKYTDLEVDDGQGGFIDLSGNRLRNSPYNSFSLLTEYSIPLGDSSDISFGLNYSYRSETYQDLFNYELNKFPSRELVDVFARWATNEEALSVSLWLKNLTDEVYPVHSFDDSGGKVALSVNGPPRRAGVTLNYRF